MKAAECESRLDSLTQKREDGKAREASRKEAKKEQKQGVQAAVRRRVPHTVHRHARMCAALRRRAPACALTLCAPLCAAVTDRQRPNRDGSHAWHHPCVPARCAARGWWSSLRCSWLVVVVVVVLAGMLVVVVWATLSLSSS